MNFCGIRRAPASALLIGALVLIGSIRGYSTPVAAQDAGGADAQHWDPELDKEIFADVARSPATQLDLGIMKTQQILETAFVANRPEIFRPDHFYRFDVEYLPVPIILVGMAYRSDATSREALLAECNADVDLALSAITRSSIPDLAASTDAERRVLMQDQRFVCQRTDTGCLEAVDHPRLECLPLGPLSFLHLLIRREVAT